MFLNKIYLQPGLYMIATPIGNMGDITVRALQTLHSLDFIYSEDTRVSTRLLLHYGIKAKLKSYHKYSDSHVVKEIVNLISSGKTVGIISDSGTPNVSDPGVDLLAAVYQSKLKAFAIPGPSSLTAAISISPINLQDFYFIGFLPKNNKEIAIIADFIQSNSLSLIYFDSPKRVKSNLISFSKLLVKDFQVIIFKEITKIYESVFYGNVNQIVNEHLDSLNKGEFVVAIKFM